MKTIIRSVVILGVLWGMSATSARAQDVQLTDSARAQDVQLTDSARAQDVQLTDSAGIGQVTASAQSQGLVVTQRPRRAGVTIRSVHDNRRRVYIIRPLVVAGGDRPVVTAPVPSDPTVAQRATGDEISKDDLRAMEDRLRQYIDARASQAPVIVQAPPPTTTVVPPGPSVTRGTGVATVPAVPDTVFIETPPPPAAITPPGVPTPQAPIALPPSDVRFIERALLETGLFRTSNIIFEFDQDQLLTYSYATIDAVGDILRRHPDVDIMVIGHTDGVGSDEYNQRLSERRANTVLIYLTENFGLGSDRVVAIGKGESEPLAPNNNSTGRAINRRVEFVVVD